MDVLRQSLLDVLLSNQTVKLHTAATNVTYSHALADPGGYPDNDV